MVTGALGEQGFDAKINPFYLILPREFSVNSSSSNSSADDAL
jgi:hypothetical protein